MDWEHKGCQQVRFVENSSKIITAIWIRVTEFAGSQIRQPYI
jgi:hypothetical protein